MENFTKLLVFLLCCLASISSQAQSNECATATVLTPGATCVGTAGTNVGATQSIAPITCGIFTSTSALDVWYQFVATATTHDITVAGGVTFDAIIDVRSGACPGTNIGCADATFTGGTEVATVGGLTIGATYFVRVYGWAGGTGTFTICVTGSTSVDPCSGITSVSCATPTTVTLTGAGIWDVTSCGFSTPGQEKIYSFTPTTSGTHTLVVSGGSGGYIDYFWKAASGGCSSSGWTCIDDISVSGTVSFGPLTAGTTYYILLDAEGAASRTQTFQITCPTPVADPCLSITSLSCATATTVTLTGSGIWDPPSTSCGFSTPGQEKIYSFTPTVSGTHTLQVTSGSGGFIDYFYKASSGGCNSSGWTCIDDISGSGTVNFGPLTAGTTYYILLDAEGTASRTQTFQITCPTPGSDPCTSITSISCATATTVNLTGTGIWSITSCGFSTPGQEKIYSFTPTTTGLHTLNVTSTNGTYIDYFWKAASDGCSSTGWTCIDDNGFTGTDVFGPLTAGTTYYILLDDENSSATSHTFQIDCPAAVPPCVSAPAFPTNGANLCTGSNVTLSWAAAAGATSYDVYYGTSSTPVFVANVASTSYNVGTPSNGTYFWQVRPRNASGPATGCAVWSFTVGDTQVPSITCPASVSANAAPGTCAATVVYGSITATDNCAPPTITLQSGQASNTSFPVGVSVIVYRATDGVGLTATCSFTVTVIDNQPPTITCPLKQNLTAQTGLCGATTTYGAITATDNCAAPTITQIGGLASGSLFPVGVTNNIWRATDAAGNTATCSFLITVTDNQLPAISCPASIITGTDPGECSAVETFNTPTATDNCPGVSVIQIGGQASGSAFATGTTTNVYRATDASGNISTCSFTVVVTDTEFPTISCPASIVRSSAFNECGRAIANLGNASVSDNCGIASQSNDSPGYFPVGTTTVTYEAFDAAGHGVSCEQTVTVNDVQGPTISCPTIVVETDADDCVGTVDYEATASDNCPGVAITYSQDSPASFGIGHSVVMAVATDASGHTAQCAIGIQVNPREEICNGIDDDCDDLVDESETWIRVAKRVAKDAQQADEYGLSVDIDGDWAIAGSTRGAYLFHRDASGQWQAGARLHEQLTPPTGSGFGHSVSIRQGTVAVGAPSDSESGTDAGAVYILRYDGTNWNLVAKVVSGDSDSGDNFGWSVAVDSSRMLVGAPGDDASGAEAGAAYVFGRNGGGSNSWGELKKLLGSDAGSGDRFGHSVAVDSAWAIVGAPGDDDRGEDAGAAYRFGKDAGGANEWGQTGKLLGNGTQAGDEFGWSVAVQGAMALVGAPGNDQQGDNTGAAFAFQNNTQVVMLTNFFVEDGARFGSGVAVDSNYAVITAPGDDPNGAGSGKGFVYLTAGQLWGLVGQLADGSVSIGDAMGSSVAMSGRTVMTGSPLDDTGLMEDHGSVLFFEGFCGDQNARPREETELNKGLAVSCYPVPFSASLNVAVNTAEGEEVQVTILNLLGQEVVRLSPQVSTGEQQLFTWQSGRAQAGVYLVKVQAGERVEIRTVILERS